MEESEYRLGSEEVVLMMMVISGMVVRVNVNVSWVCLREEVLYTGWEL